MSPYRSPRIPSALCVPLFVAALLAVLAAVSCAVQVLAP